VNDAELALVEARVARYGGTARLDVLDLLAECRRLREPPDVSGLMPAAELAQVRAWVGDGPSSAPAALAELLAHADAQAALIRELYGVIADLHADDPGRQALLGRGAGEMLYRVLALTRESFGDPAAADYPELADTLRRLRALGPARPPLPPSESEREAERLREALRQINGLPGWSEDESRDIARRALGDA
jgi:hypothetical protein